FGDIQVVVIRLTLQLDTVGVVPGRRLDPQAGHRIRPGWPLIQKLVGQTKAYVPYIGVTFYRGLAEGGAGSACTGGLVGGFPVDEGQVYIKLPALTPVVAGGQVEGKGVRIDLVHTQVTEEDGIQRQEAVQEQLPGVIVAVGKA